MSAPISDDDTDSGPSKYAPKPFREPPVRSSAGILRPSRHGWIPRRQREVGTDGQVMNWRHGRSRSRSYHENRLPIQRWR
jgi:hypothetical protein